MESFKEPGHISSENLLEVPALSDSLSEDEDVKATLQPRFSPSPRRRNSDSSEEMEPEAPSTIARKVSFADAFGFDLVSVKEFDTWDVPITLPNDEPEDEVVPVEEFYLTPLFTLPTTQEQLLQKVRAQKVGLESIEFLPGITCMKGIIRVLNVSFEKLVYVRMTLDNWLTYYDILGEYVPNSCDGETDQFLFKISLVPPYQRDGATVEFCIRYETSVGIFWENNDNHNYILICHKKETAPPSADNQLQEEVTDKNIRGCLKGTGNSKEEILAMADEDIWNTSRTSGSDIPQILYSHVDDNETEQRKEKVDAKNVGHNEDDNENEKELELLLSHHFSRTGGSSRDERSLYTAEPVRFPNDPQEFGDKLDSGLLRQPLPLSSSSEHALQDKELHSKSELLSSVGADNSQSSSEKVIAVDSVKNSTQSSEFFNTIETPLSPEYWPGTEKNETIYIAEVISSNNGMFSANVQKDEPQNAPESKTMESLFINVDDDDCKKVWKTRPQRVPLEHGEEEIQLRGKLLEGMDDVAEPVQGRCMQEPSCQIHESILESTVGNESKGESENQEHVKRMLNTNTLPDVGVTVSSFRCSPEEDDTVKEKFKTEYNVDKGKEIMLSLLESSPEEKQVYSTHGHEKHITLDKDEASTVLELPQEAEVTIFSVVDEKKDEKIHQSTELPHLQERGSSSKTSNIEESKGPVVGELSLDLKRTESRYQEAIQNTGRCSITPADERSSIHSASINLEEVFDTSGNLDERKYNQSYGPGNRNILESEPCQSETDRIITDDQSSQVMRENQSWSASESQLAERESEKNKRTQMKERSGDETMWGIRDNTICLNVTPADELFTCQDPGRDEESAVAKHDSTGEAEAVTAAYIIKMTSESTPEKISAGEKAVIVKLPQETALSDRPTEEKETVFDIHEGRNDGSHYPLCQCNTVGVLYDTKFEKESVLDICKARVHETMQGEMISVCNTSEMLARAEHNTGNDSPLGEILWTSTEGKAASEQDLYLETSLKGSQHLLQGLYNEEAEEGSTWKSPHVAAKTENKNSPSDLKRFPEHSSLTFCEDSMGANTSEGREALHPFMDMSGEIVAESRCNFSAMNDTGHVISSTSSEDELPSSEKGERSIDQVPHQPEFEQGKLLGPTILISEPTEEREKTRLESEGLLMEEKWNSEEHENQPVSDHTDVSDQQREAFNLPSECLVLKHIGYKTLYFLFFVVFCVTLYHYDLIVCFALYLFSLYWLYCKDTRSK
ncbi:protein phosphatase 1 regulatory subunit 3A [Varanus komodoensis]|uniref:protein phosphatase 1 regulatory subunit 3A n=1 Tax=Varanus komodoensis TaxID=61221 RepID=UPI001CF79110|nr:protein phosphatase 1 regulatory subunit 3A [Varanus komodoensis]